MANLPKTEFLIGHAKTMIGDAQRLVSSQKFSEKDALPYILGHTGNKINLPSLSPGALADVLENVSDALEMSATRATPVFKEVSDKLRSAQSDLRNAITQG